MRLLIILSLFIAHPDSFREEQRRYPRVRQAYAEKESMLKEMLAGHSVDMNEMELYLRAFKEEKKMEVWAKNLYEDTFRLVIIYPVCMISGVPGPKRKEYDFQIPEGYYHISVFNSYSNFHLSLGLNYPNQSDRILGDREKPGSDIFIHGSCATMGCLPITDDIIKELYILCVEAKNNGQDKIPVTIFPAELTDEKYRELLDTYPSDQDRLKLWASLKKGWEIFNEGKRLPEVKVGRDGGYVVE